MARRARLDQGAVIDAAAALVDQVGLDRLNLAQLAEQLEVRTPSLYNHVPSIAELRQELALRGLLALTTCLGRAAIGKSGNAAVLAVAAAYRSFAHEHPGLYAASLRAPDPANPALQRASEDLIDIMRAILAAYDLHDDLALHVIRGLRSIVHGFVSLEAAGGFGLPLDRDESYRLLLEMFLRGLENAARATAESA